METHNIALTALNKIEAHAEECMRRQERYENNQREIKQNIESLGSEIKSLNKYVAIGIGILIIIGKLLDWWVSFHQNGGHL